MGSAERDREAELAVGPASGSAGAGGGLHQTPEKNGGVH
jgi:hypothetical protein